MRESHRTPLSREAVRRPADEPLEGQASLHARARLLDHGSEDDRHAAKPLRRKYPFTQGVFVPLAHKVTRTPTLHYEVRPLKD